MSDKKRHGYDRAIFGFRSTLTLLSYVLLIVLFIFLGRTAYVFGYDLFHEQSAEEAPGRDVTVTIPENASVSEIADILKDDGVITNKLLFRIQERLSAYHGELQGGTFQLNTSETPTEIMAILAGDSTVSSARTESDSGGTSSDTTG